MYKIPDLSKPHIAQHQDVVYNCHYSELRINVTIPKCFKCSIELAKKKKSIYFQHFFKFKVKLTFMATSRQQNSYTAAAHVCYRGGGLGW